MAEATCSSCPWWVNPDEGWGTCRRFPPSVPVPGLDQARVWPETEQEDFCGEHPARQPPRADTGPMWRVPAYVYKKETEAD